MGDSLFNYIDMKIHPVLKNSTSTPIVVRGKYARDSQNISVLEKNDKLVNWKRPTVEIGADGKYYYNCFPGQDYIYHYFRLLTTYYKIHNIEQAPTVSFEKCTKKKTYLSLIHDTNIKNVPKADIYILGIVHHFFEASEFEGDGDFIWKTLQIKGKNIVYLGCKFSIWGDIAGEVARYLAHHGARQIIYIGKLGGLKGNFIPNCCLSTGSYSRIGTKAVHWDNLFADVKTDSIIHGKHITVPSILQETTDWLKDTTDKFDFVDPEIGRIAAACQEEHVQFSYLHIISDNLKQKYKEDLSNERNETILSKRKNLYSTIKNILADKHLL